MPSPVFIVSTGRCGSTMLSKVVRQHPDILSVSEFFTALGTKAFVGGHVTGEAMYKRLNSLAIEGRTMLENELWVDEFLYEFGPESRYQPHSVPPVMGTTLPHLTDDAEALWDELGPAVRRRGKAALADHYEFVFGWLADRFGKSMWVERSGASILFVPTLARLWPEARFVHIYRDGRDTAMSMQKHHYFRWRVRFAQRVRRVWIDPFHPVNLPGTSPWIPWVSWMWAKFVFNVDKYRREVIPLSTFGKYWSDMIERGVTYLKALPPEKVLAVSYEKVLADPHGELGRFIRFIGPEFEHPEWIETVAALIRPQKPRWHRLSQEEIDAVSAACEPGQSILGYDNRTSLE